MWHGNRGGGGKDVTCEAGGGERAHTFDFGSTSPTTMASRRIFFILLAVLAAGTCADAERLLQQQHHDVTSFVDALRGAADGEQSFSTYLSELDRLGLDAALEGRESRMPCLVRGPRVAPCLLFYCPPAPCVVRAPAPLTPDQGPFTVLAIPDDAMDALFASWAPSAATKLTLKDVREDPALAARLEDVVRYSIVPGAAITTDDVLGGATAAAEDAISPTPKASNTFKTLRNVTHATGGDVVLVPKNASRIAVNAACVDKPPPGEHGCADQVAWGKCDEDWMNDEGKESGRPLGYCEASCGKCECAEDDPACAAEIAVPDLRVFGHGEGEDRNVSVVVHVMSAAVEPPNGAPCACACGCGSPSFHSPLLHLLTRTLISLSLSLSPKATPPTSRPRPPLRRCLPPSWCGTRTATGRRSWPSSTSPPAPTRPCPRGWLRPLAHAWACPTATSGIPRRAHMNTS